MRHHDPITAPTAAALHRSAVIAALVALVLGLLPSPVQAAAGRVVDRGEEPVLELDSTDNPVLLFRQGGEARVMRCYDPNCAGPDDFSRGLIIDFSTHFNDMSMVLDADDRPVVLSMFVNIDFGLRFGIKLLRCTRRDCSEEPLRQTYDYTSTSTRPALALDAGGNPVLAYPGRQNFLTILHCTHPTCGEETDFPHRQDDRITTPGNAVGRGLSLQVDAANNPVVSYRRGDDIVLLHCNDPDCAGIDDPATTVATSVGPDLSGTSLALDDAGNPVIAFADSNGVGVVHCNDPDCAGGDDVARRLGTGETGAPSLALHGDNPVVAYEGQAGVTLLRCNDPRCVGGGDTTRLLDAGHEPSLDLDTAGNPVVAYSRTVDDDDQILLLRCDNPTCGPDVGGEPDLTCGGRAATIVGTDGDDRLLGTNGPDVIVGLAGNDEILGFGGDDTLCGNGGNDKLFGHGGEDVLLGGGGDDRLFGNAGTDRLHGDQGNDVLDGGSQADDLFGGDGRDGLAGSGGDDTLFGGRGGDGLRGGTGDDLLLCGPDEDRLIGQSGSDTLRGSSGDDRLDGDAR